MDYIDDLSYLKISISNSIVQFQRELSITMADNGAVKLLRQQQEKPDASLNTYVCTYIDALSVKNI